MVDPCINLDCSFGKYWCYYLEDSLVLPQFEVILRALVVNLYLRNKLEGKTCEDAALAKHGTLSLELSIHVYLYRPVVYFSLYRNDQTHYP